MTIYLLNKEGEDIQSCSLARGDDGHPELQCGDTEVPFSLESSGGDTYLKLGYMGVDQIHLPAGQDAYIIRESGHFYLMNATEISALRQTKPGGFTWTVQAQGGLKGYSAPPASTVLTLTTTSPIPRSNNTRPASNPCNDGSPFAVCQAYKNAHHIPPQTRAGSPSQGEPGTIDLSIPQQAEGEKSPTVGETVGAQGSVLWHKPDGHWRGGGAAGIIYFIQDKIVLFDAGLIGEVGSENIGFGLTASAAIETGEGHVSGLFGAHTYIGGGGVFVTIGAKVDHDGNLMGQIGLGTRQTPDDSFDPTPALDQVTAGQAALFYSQSADKLIAETRLLIANAQAAPKNSWYELRYLTPIRTNLEKIKGLQGQERSWMHISGQPLPIENIAPLEQQMEVLSRPAPVQPATVVPSVSPARAPLDALENDLKELCHLFQEPYDDQIAGSISLMETAIQNPNALKGTDKSFQDVLQLINSTINICESIEKLTGKDATSLAALALAKKVKDPLSGFKALLESILQRPAPELNPQSSPEKLIQRHLPDPSKVSANPHQVIVALKFDRGIASDSKKLKEQLKPILESLQEKELKDNLLGIVVITNPQAANKLSTAFSNTGVPFSIKVPADFSLAKESAVVGEPDIDFVYVHFIMKDVAPSFKDVTNGATTNHLLEQTKTLHNLWFPQELHGVVIQPKAPSMGNSGARDSISILTEVQNSLEQENLAYIPDKGGGAYLAQNRYISNRPLEKMLSFTFPDQALPFFVKLRQESIGTSGKVGIAPENVEALFRIIKEQIPNATGLIIVGYGHGYKAKGVENNAFDDAISYTPTFTKVMKVFLQNGYKGVASKLAFFDAKNIISMGGGQMEFGKKSTDLPFHIIVVRKGVELKKVQSEISKVINADVRQKDKTGNYGEH